MRRRRAERRLTADETVAMHQRVQREAEDMGLREDAARTYVNAFLALHQTDVVRALRARRWIRFGRPARTQWDR